MASENLSVRVFIISVIILVIFLFIGLIIIILVYRPKSTSCLTDQDCLSNQRCVIKNNTGTCEATTPLQSSNMTTIRSVALPSPQIIDFTSNSNMNSVMNTNMNNMNMNNMNNTTRSNLFSRTRAFNNFDVLDDSFSGRMKRERLDLSDQSEYDYSSYNEPTIRHNHINQDIDDEVNSGDMVITSIDDEVNSGDNLMDMNISNMNTVSNVNVINNNLIDFDENDSENNSGDMISFNNFDIPNTVSFSNLNSIFNSPIQTIMIYGNPFMLYENGDIEYLNQIRKSNIKVSKIVLFEDFVYGLSGHTLYSINRNLLNNINYIWHQVSWVNNVNNIKLEGKTFTVESSDKNITLIAK